MISLQEIAQKIEHPEMVNVQELDELKSLTEKYPYTQLFSILYLKGMSASGNVHFEDELKQHSYRIGDRVQLYQLISDHDQQDHPVVVSEPKQVSEEIPPAANELVQEAEPELPKEKEEEMVSSDEIETNDVIIISSTDPVEDIVEPSELAGQGDEIVESSETPVQGEIVSADNPLDETILHHALTANYQLDALNEEEEIELEERQSSTEIEVIISDTPSIDLDTKQPFSSWLSADENYEVTENDDKLAIEAIVNDFTQFDPSNDDLFGEVEKPKQPFFSPTQKAKESLNEETLPVSETLAKIYIVQGNYPQAISAYEQLSLKYPEKKIFFANQIRDLKKKLKA